MCYNGCFIYSVYFIKNTRNDEKLDFLPICAMHGKTY